MKSKMLKIICGIIGMISWISLAFFLLTSFWFWVSFEFLAAILVAIGCGGEWWLHHHPAGRKKKEKDEQHKLESRFIASVAIGVIMELFALGHSIKEGAHLEKEVGQLESTNLVARAHIVDLERQIEQAKTKIDSVDPRTKPIKDASAVAFLTIYESTGFRGNVELTGQIAVFDSKNKTRFLLTSTDCEERRDEAILIITMRFKFRTLIDDRPLAQIDEVDDFEGLLRHRVDVIDSLNSITLTLNSNEINGRKLLYSGNVVFFLNSESEVFFAKKQYFSNSPVVLTGFRVE